MPINRVRPASPSSKQASTSLIALGREALARSESPEFGIHGLVGDAIFASELSRYDPQIKPEDHLAVCVDAFSKKSGNVTLHGGLAGLGFLAAAYFREPNLLIDIDKLLLRSLTGLPSASVQSGLAGIGLYASLRSRTATGRQLQRAIVDILASTAVTTDTCIVWHTPPWYAKGRDVTVLSEPITEFGILHGTSGAVVALAGLAKQGNPSAAEILRTAVRGLWGWQRAGSNRFGRIYFGGPLTVTTREFEYRTWCVGDVGILRDYWQAAKVINDTESASRCLALLVEDANRVIVDHEWPGIPGRLDLCCGLAAVGHVFWHMHRDTGEFIFDSASKILYKTCLHGVSKMKELSFSHGLKGTILALLAALTNDAPLWDGILGMRLLD